MDGKELVGNEKLMIKMMIRVAPGICAIISCSIPLFLLECPTMNMAKMAGFLMGLAVSGLVMAIATIRKD